MQPKGIEEKLKQDRELIFETPIEKMEFDAEYFVDFGWRGSVYVDGKEILFVVRLETKIVALKSIRELVDNIKKKRRCADD